MRVTETEEGNNLVETISSNSGRSSRLRRRRNKAVVALAVAVAALAAMAGCTPGDVFDSDFKEVDSSGWRKSQPLVFEQPDSILGGAETYAITLCVRHDSSYPYRNLWLAADFVAGGRVVESDTVSVELSDGYGNWEGSGIGRLYQRSVTLRQRVGVGSYDRVVVWHAMRPDAVAGLSDIGLVYSTVK